MSNLIDSLYEAGHDDRKATGQLYLDARSRIIELERLCSVEFSEMDDPTYQQWIDVAGRNTIAELNAKMTKIGAKVSEILAEELQCNCMMPPDYEICHCGNQADYAEQSAAVAMHFMADELRVILESEDDHQA